MSTAFQQCHFVDHHLCYSGFHCVSSVLSGHYLSLLEPCAIHLNISEISLQHHFSFSLKRNTCTLRCSTDCPGHTKEHVDYLDGHPLSHRDLYCYYELEVDQIASFSTPSQVFDFLSLLFPSLSCVAVSSRGTEYCKYRKHCDQQCCCSWIQEHDNCRNCDRGTEHCETQLVEAIAFHCYCVHCVGIRENPWKQIEDRSSTSNSTYCSNEQLFTGNSFTCDIALDVVDHFLLLRNWILGCDDISLETPIIKDLSGRCVSTVIVLHPSDDIDTCSTSHCDPSDSRTAMDFCLIGKQRFATTEQQTTCCTQPYADQELVCDHCQEHQLLPDSVKAEIIDQAPPSVLEIEDAYLCKKSGLSDVATPLTSSSCHDPLTHLPRHESLVIVVRSVVQLISLLPRLTHKVLTFIRRLDIQIHLASDEDRKTVKAFCSNTVIVLRLFCIKTDSYKGVSTSVLKLEIDSHSNIPLIADCRVGLPRVNALNFDDSTSLRPPSPSIGYQWPFSVLSCCSKDQQSVEGA